MALLALLLPAGGQPPVARAQGMGGSTLTAPVDHLGGGGGAASSPTYTLRESSGESIGGGPTSGASLNGEGGFQAASQALQPTGGGSTDPGTDPGTGGGGGKKKSGGIGCMIAAATRGTPLAGELAPLRAFRDRVLRPSAAGQALVRGYYRASPTVIAAMEEYPALAGAIRAALRPTLAMLGQPTRGVDLLAGALLFPLALLTLALAVFMVKRRSGLRRP